MAFDPAFNETLWAVPSNECTVHNAVTIASDGSAEMRIGIS